MCELFCPAHKSFDPLQMRSRNQWPHFTAFIGTERDRRNRIAKRLDQPCIHAFLRVDTAGGGAVLSGVVETEGAHPSHYLSDIRIIENNHRCLAAEFHVRALDTAD